MASKKKPVQSSSPKGAGLRRRDLDRNIDAMEAGRPGPRTAKPSPKPKRK